MKLVRISEDAIIDIDDIQFAVWDDEKQEVRIEFKNTDAFIYTKDQKVLDAISSSEEYLEDSENKYNISITTDNTGSNKVGTRSQVLSLLDQLKNDETLTIKLTKQKARYGNSGQTK